MNKIFYVIFFIIHIFIYYKAFHNKCIQKVDEYYNPDLVPVDAADAVPVNADDPVVHEADDPIVYEASYVGGGDSLVKYGPHEASYVGGGDSLVIFPPLSSKVGKKPSVQAADEVESDHFNKGEWETHIYELMKEKWVQDIFFIIHIFIYYKAFHDINLLSPLIKL